jgi:predicted  nucleic acid-binding Zn-ribbon protein
MSDGERDPGLVPMFKNLRWKARLKREALEARVEAEAARTNPDDKKLAKLRQDAARVKAEEDDLTSSIDEEQKKDAQSKAEMEKAFEGIRGVGMGTPHTP